MADSSVGVCEIELYLAGVASLKEKRSIIKSLLARLRKQFNVAVAEIAYHDVWQSSKIGISTISNSAVHNEQMLQTILRWLEEHYPDVLITHHETEIL